MRVQFHFHTIRSTFSHADKATVMCVKWNHNGNWLTSAARDHLIKIFDIRRDVNSKWFAHYEVDPIDPIWMCPPG